MTLPEVAESHDVINKQYVFTRIVCSVEDILSTILVPGVYTFVDLIWLNIAYNVRIVLLYD
jgi:hypothetical protein